MAKLSGKRSCTTRGKKTTTAAKSAPASYGAARALASHGDARKPSCRATFLSRIYLVLSDARYHQIIHWDESGTVIVVQDERRLGAEVCPTVFQQHKGFPSFSRQMNIWKWSRIDDKATATKGSSSWKHPEGLNKWSTPADLAAITRHVRPRVVPKKATKAPYPSFPDYFDVEDDVELAPPSPLLASYLTPSSTASSTPVITPAATPSPIFQSRPFGQIPGVHGQFFFQGSPLAPLVSSWNSSSYGGNWSLPQTPLGPSQLRQSFGCEPVDLHQLGLADGVTAAEVEGLAAAVNWPECDGFF